MERLGEEEMVIGQIEKVIDVRPGSVGKGVSDGGLG